MPETNGRVLLATVKGDVHDIGKNIVGVVLGCNNYEVIDLGVMVPADRILDTAVEKQVDIIGLSGLITPSLDEMVFVAREMERRGMTLPLLIGGATTSRQHTAVKIAPEFSGATVHVLDASRAVDVVSSLLSDSQRDDFIATARAEQADLRERHSLRRERPLLTLEAARANHLQTDWDTLQIAAPWFVGRRVIEPSLEELLPFIDWTFFFAAWELKGRFPAILGHPEYGAAARELYENAQAVLARIVADKLLTARGVYGFWPANTDGDDIVVYKDDARKTELARFHMLRQQEPIADDKPNRSLADFVAPRESLAPDYIGAFAVTAGIGADELVREYERSTTTTTPSSPRRWPIGWPRRSPSTCTRRRARTGAMARGEGRALARRSDRGEVSRHPAGVRLSGLSRSQRKVDAVRRCSTPLRSASRSPSRSR